jgi:hypothetical protein
LREKLFRRRYFTDEAAYLKACANFVGQVCPSVASAAEVIIPAGGLATLYWRANLSFS